MLVFQAFFNRTVSLLSSFASQSLFYTFAPGYFVLVVCFGPSIAHLNEQHSDWLNKFYLVSLKFLQ